ncbi:hypothetical protein NEOLEDRAFT_1183876 [Neolentinus lepideus HHB14362 ss-1]|uniref:Uncharacterized protein n=1 Tax=Neolentinus lepideus HHB14362 ss-1 TaxID=1314782 RepID=A0A165MXS5_9AGAM|nr:hypothetical protein NEOLEDRAFT_1183876 [Neolentinus lepideus HHB14362 ss-1]
MYSLSMRFVRNHDTQPSSSDVPKTRGRRASWLAKALSRKASPTVSLVNTSASCSTTSGSPLSAIAMPGIVFQAPKSSVPFPSAPIPLPYANRTSSQVHHSSTKRKPFPPYTLDDLNDLESDDKPITVSPSANSPPWHIQLHRRRRAQSCLVQTYFHDQNKEVISPRLPLRTRKDRPRDRAMSDSIPPGISTPKPVIRQPKARKANRKHAEMYFLAAVYRSIKWFVEYRGHEPRRLAPRADVMNEQDKLFLVRLHDNLLLQGCQPTLLNVCPSPEPSFLYSSSQLSLSDLDPPSSPMLGAAPPASSPEVLTPPQVVASLILRHRDRAAVRPRSSSPAGRVARGTSPLRDCVVVLS